MAAPVRMFGASLPPASPSFAIHPRQHYRTPQRHAAGIRRAHHPTSGRDRLQQRRRPQPVAAGVAIPRPQQRLATARSHHGSTRVVGGPQRRASGSATTMREQARDHHHRQHSTVAGLAQDRHVGANSTIHRSRQVPAGARVERFREQDGRPLLTQPPSRSRSNERPPPPPLVHENSQQCCRRRKAHQDDVFATSCWSPTR